MNLTKSVTAIIHVNASSKNLHKKITRPFGDTNLLSRKIETLKNVRGVDQIIVTSNDEGICEIASQHGVIVCKKDLIDSSNKTRNAFDECLSRFVNTPLVMYVPCTSPFLQKQKYEDMINKYFEVCNTHDSIVSCLNNTIVKNTKHRADQEAESFHTTYGATIMATDLINTDKTITESKPYFYPLNQLEGIDIDTEYDFVVASLLHDNGILTYNDIHDFLQVRATKPSPKILDCTIRDGGFQNNWQFTNEQVEACYDAVSQAGADYFEIGFMFNNEDTSKGKWWNCKEGDLDIVKQSCQNGCKLASMVHLENVHKIDKKLSNLDMIRVLVNVKKTKLTEVSLAFYQDKIKHLISLGYEVCVNLAYIDTLTEDELKKALFLAVPGLTYLYLADSFGSMGDNQVRDFIRKIHKLKGTGVPIGFHAHDNMQNAYSKSLIAIENGAKIVDATILGYGRGGGNLKAEFMYMNMKKDVRPLLDFADKHLKNWKNSGVLFGLSGVLKVHPEYVNYLMNEENITVLGAYEILMQLSHLSKHLNKYDYSEKLIKEVILQNSTTFPKPAELVYT